MITLRKKPSTSFGRLKVWDTFEYMGSIHIVLEVDENRAKSRRLPDGTCFDWPRDHKEARRVHLIIDWCYAE